MIPVFNNNKNYWGRKYFYSNNKVYRILKTNQQHSHDQLINLNHFQLTLISWGKKTVKDYWS